MENALYNRYVEILKEELIPSFGCTEPISIAYASSLAFSLLDEMPTKVVISASANIIKNAKSVVVPNTGGEKGIEKAAIAGIVSSHPEAKLEVLSFIKEEDIPKIKELSNTLCISVKRSERDYLFSIIIELSNDKEKAICEIAGKHTNVIKLGKNGNYSIDKDYKEEKEKKESELSIKSIVEFADTVNISDIEETIERQIKYNQEIAEEGLKNRVGANIGAIILSSSPMCVRTRAKAYPAAASDARMNGSNRPVIINSGSGNQGLTVSLPVIQYAKEKNSSKEELIRALSVSNLVAIHLKRGIGCLSAYCGATTASIGAASGICYLYGGREDEISHTVANGLAIASGMICDGAKASCAAKIAIALDASLLGLEMVKSGSEFHSGEGIVVKGVENTINNISSLAREGMKETDSTIIRLMTDN